MVHLFLSIFCLSLWSASDYTLSDLEVLVAEDAHKEFFAHALDIRPSERQEAWKGMVVKMGDSYSRKILEKSEIEQKDFLEMEKLFTWPVLKNDDVYKARRREAGLRYIRKCLKASAPCWEDLKAFWEKDKTDVEKAYKLAELTSHLPESPLSTWTLLEVALKSPLSEFYCKKPFVMEVLWGKLEIDYVKLGVEGDLLKKIDQTIHGDCVPMLVKESQKRLFHPPKTFDRELAFQILKALGKANVEVQDFFYTVYLLDNPSQGELFNYSWNRLKELGGKSERRDKVLQKIHGLDPLPDQIFSSLDVMKRRVVLKHFRTYFPEYLDHYTNQCLKYYGGKGSFPQGNPTIHCQDFMNSDLAPQIIDDFKIKQYQDVRRI